MPCRLFSLIALTGTLLSAHGVTVPVSVPQAAASVDPALVGVSFEFFAFPQYTTITSTTNCLANIGALRGTAPHVRIGGTTQ